MASGRAMHRRCCWPPDIDIQALLLGLLTATLRAWQSSGGSKVPPGVYMLLLVWCVVGLLLGILSIDDPSH